MRSASCFFSHLKTDNNRVVVFEDDIVSVEIPVDPIEVNTYDPEERAREKAAQRAQDEEDLREGRITAEELRARNAPLARLLCRPDFSKARMK